MHTTADPPLDQAASFDDLSDVTNSLTKRTFVFKAGNKEELRDWMETLHDDVRKHKKRIDAVREETDAWTPDTNRCATHTNIRRQQTCNTSTPYTMGHDTVRKKRCHSRGDAIQPIRRA